jgi:hypothetical protein
MLTKTIVKFIHEASTYSETEGFETQSSMQTLPTPTHEIQLGEGASDQPLSPNGNLTLPSTIHAKSNRRSARLTE